MRETNKEGFGMRKEKQRKESEKYVRKQSGLEEMGIGGMTFFWGGGGILIDISLKLRWGKWNGGVRRKEAEVSSLFFI